MRDDLGTTLTLISTQPEAIIKSVNDEPLNTYVMTAVIAEKYQIKISPKTSSSFSFAVRGDCLLHYLASLLYTYASPCQYYQAWLL